MTPCKHLDYDEARYPSCRLVADDRTGCRYWIRPSPYEGAATRVQFCRLRGRINDVFSCLNPGERCCHEALNPPAKEPK